MNRLPFGTRVHVAAVVEPRYLTWQTRRTVFDPSSLGPMRMGRQVPVDPPVLIDPRHEHIGDPLPGTTDVRAGGLHRRLRRFGQDASGVVVGWVWRAEGHYHEADEPRYFDEEGDGGQAYLDESGRHRLYQVALDPGEVGKRFAPADVVLVHPDDVEVAP